jgi:flagellar assembly protein FliH
MPETGDALLSLSGMATGISGRLEPFEYEAIPGVPELIAWDGFAETEAAAVNPVGSPGNADPDAANHKEKFEQRLAEETMRSFEAGRERGRQEGRQMERDAMASTRAAADEQRAQQAAGLMAQFSQECDRYLHTVEHEVVKLALAVAARILRREAQMDPLLLTGAVRVALGQLAASTQVRLRVPADELSLWKDAMALLPNLSVKPQVVAEDGMRLGDCRVESELGSVDLGIRSQLGEIERGFFDRAGNESGKPTEPAQVVAGGER